MERQHDVDEIDRLIRDLAADKHMRKTASSSADGADAAAPGEPRPGSRWSNVTMRMPSTRTITVWSRVAALAAVVLRRVQPAGAALQRYLPDVRRLLKMPGSVATIRAWVTLGVLCAASMTYWPYPMTYLWGIVIYQLCLWIALVAGVWGARLSWDARLGAAHTLALGTVGWAVALGTVQTMTLV